MAKQLLQGQGQDQGEVMMSMLLAKPYVYENLFLFLNYHLGEKKKWRIKQAFPCLYGSLFFFFYRFLSLLSQVSWMLIIVFFKTLVRAASIISITT